MKTRIKSTILVDNKRKFCRIFDNGGRTFDRYTIAFKSYRSSDGRLYYPYIASSDHPYGPLGFGQHGESKEFLTGKHLGERVSFDFVPGDVQKFILENI